MNIRSITHNDMPGLKVIIGATGLFPPDLLDGMTAPHLNGEAPEDIWLTTEADGLAALAYCAPERMTDNTWNLLLIATAPGRQRSGLGRAMVHHVERTLISRGGRLLLVETSAHPEFDGTRAFYRSLGYGQEARIRDFYREGEDKIVFRRVLASTR